MTEYEQTLKAFSFEDVHGLRGRLCGTTLVSVPFDFSHLPALDTDDMEVFFIFITPSSVLAIGMLASFRKKSKTESHCRNNCL